VEAALRRLHETDSLSLVAIREISLSQLENLIRPAGYFRQKATRLKLFVNFVDTCYGGSLTRMFAQPTGKLRDELLTLNGVGPETADSILLYAGQHEVFVVDAYARRILERHSLAEPAADYEEIRTMFEGALSSLLGADGPKSSPGVGQFPAHEPSPVSRLARSPLAQIYNDMHGLIVAVGKHYCLKSNPNCEACPLGSFLSAYPRG